MKELASISVLHDFYIHSSLFQLTLYSYCGVFLHFQGYSMRLSTCFWACGMMLATSIAISLLIAAGYKPK